MSEHILQLMIQERDRLSAAIAALKGASDARLTAPKPAPRARRKMSAEARAKIVAAAKKRWRLIKAGKAPSTLAKKKAA